AGLDYFVTYEQMTTLHLVVSTGLSVWLIFSYMQSGGDSSGTLILLYWMLMLPQLGCSLGELTQLYPALRNRLLRLLEPLNAPDESYTWYPPDDQTAPPQEASHPPEAKGQTADKGVAVHFQNVHIILAGKTVLKNLNTCLYPGEQVAVVGPSGAGKSTLVGLLLGWHRPATGGKVWVDNELLQGKRLQQVRRELVWVDPEVQLWNRSLQDNLNYGNESSGSPSVELLSQADLLTILSRLPDDAHTLLGENGGFLSGGEGQRVRLGRGMNRTTPRLVILDEPFRGLTREQRRDLLAKARRYWQEATLIFISHDVGDSLGFDRVWLIQDGQLLEDAHPQRLAAQPDSAYARLLQREKSVRELIWGSADWVRLRLDHGKLYQDNKKTDHKVGGPTSAA
ncbi:MAG: ATP-binding cassette domain-containing protein, partial [Candidatus Electrothrix sp. AR3]|nr:ATP-binding cassette domain-containing protein [Candidatus Electrothrix sp. AR3]